MKNCSFRNPLLVVIVCVTVAGVDATGAHGQTGPVSEETVVVVPGARYAAGGIHRFLFGSRYRDLWNTPIAVDVLDLANFAGGLNPVRGGGQGQSRTLHLDGADGRRYVFRSVDKALGVPEEFRSTFIEDEMQDMKIAAFHPASAMVVDPLLTAAGILHVSPHFYVMPDDPRLGRFREDYAGVLGMLEERPNEGPDSTAGFAGSYRIVSTETLFDRLEESTGNRLADLEYLRARFMDMWMGDRNRHVSQWRWARFGEPGNYVWRPVPRDRDEAFVANDGFFWWLARRFRPRFATFREDYPGVSGLTETGWNLDRVLLTGISRTEWDSVATDLVGRLTDNVIHDAVLRLPPPMHELNGTELERTLIARRDDLHRIAMEYYEFMAHDVDVWATDEAEYAHVTHREDGSVLVEVWPIEGDSVGRLYYSRLFAPGETAEVRMYMRGGDDRVVVDGPGFRLIRVRIVGGGGDDVLADSSTTGGVDTWFYDGRGDNQIQTTEQTRVDTRRYRRHLSSDPTHRWVLDWGHSDHPAFVVNANADHGLILEFGFVRRTRGFRKDPYQHRMSLTAGLSTDGRFVANFSNRYPSMFGPFDAAWDMSVTGVRRHRFFGMGNNTPSVSAPANFHRVDRYIGVVSPTLSVRVVDGLRLTGGPLLKLSDTSDDNGRIIDGSEYGAEFFAQVGAEGTIDFDATSGRTWRRRGLRITGHWSGYPALLDVRQTFWEIDGQIRGYLPVEAPLQPVLAARFALKKVQGRVPFHEAAYIGGNSTLRGFDRQRFAGEAAVWGSMEARFQLGSTRIVSFPTDFGVFALTDIGRVWVAGESPGGWHQSVGGGVWIAPLRRRTVVSLAAATSDEQTSVYLRLGFGF